jgi:GT2 family glycosyltransferase/SAM-dependent methyltransferase
MSGNDPAPSRTGGAVQFPRVAGPAASIVIPVHGKWSLTQGCLEALAADRGRNSFEVIVVDDCSPDDTARRLSEIPGVVTVKTPRNLGFLRAANLGARAARADVLVFLNNDTDPHAGWLDALLDVLEGDAAVGLAGAMLLGTNGLVQECGGIVWSDGTGCNYGRGMPPSRPEVRAVRDVDYCSGAAIAVRKAIFDDLGGFDERYAPAYYEDTDLSFAVRAAGHRAVVVPTAVVTHLEGGSHGTAVTGGIKRFQEVNRHTFVRKWRDVLVGHGSAKDPAAAWIARNRRPRGMVLIADARVPTPNRDSGSRRMWAIIDELLDIGHSVHFAPLNHHAPEPYVSALERKSVTVLATEADQNRFMREAGPRLEAILLSRPDTAWAYLDRVFEHAPDATVIFDTVDLHSLRARREAHLRRDRRLARGADLVWARELAAIEAADITFVVAQYEKDLLASLAPAADVRVVSNIHTPVVTAPDVARRSGVLFVGGYQHHPNVDAARWAATRIMPRVREVLPDAVLTLAGSQMPTEVRDLAGPGVDVIGWVDDLAPVYATHRVVIAPLRYGAGVKGKVGEAIEHGIPVVGTTVAVEGMHLIDGVDAVIADDEAPFADGVVRLLTDDGTWYAIARSAQDGLTEHFSANQARAVLEDAMGPSNRDRRTERVARRGRSTAPPALDVATTVDEPNPRTTLVPEPGDRLLLGGAISATRDLDLRRIDSRAELGAIHRRLGDRLAVERDLANRFQGQKEWHLAGYCQACRAAVQFDGDWVTSDRVTINFRERLVCPSCNLNTRQRMMAHLVREVAGSSGHRHSIYLYEQVTPFYRWLTSAIDADVTGSEYLGYDVAAGAEIGGVRHEDALALSFEDDRFDIIVSNDVFEHVPDIDRALGECARVLRSDGMLLFSIPFCEAQDRTVKRARLVGSDVEHLHPAVYHGNPVSNGGSLVFYDHGWDLFERIRESDFSDAYALGYWSYLYGYLGNGIQLIFVADKSASTNSP